MIELNKIYCENCLDTMSRMPDNFIDLTVTSPPYDDMDDDFNPIPKNGMRTYNGYSWDFKRIAQELYRVTRTGGVVVWVVNDPTINGSESLASSLQKIYFRRCGFNIHDTMIYEKSGTGACGSNNTYWQNYEFMIVLSKEYVKTFNSINDRKNIKDKGMFHWTRGHRLLNGNKQKKRIMELREYGRRYNIWKYNVSYHSMTNDEIASDHPAIFPEQFARDHIYSWSNEGDLIYDPFMGSGTVAKMAHLMKRNWIGSEISQEYVDLANKRIDPYLRQQALAL